MRRPSTLGVFSALALAPAALADQVPGTLNFTNETATRIDQNVAEDPGDNVKDVTHADFDEDGDLDAAIAAAGGVFGNRKNKLYRNDEGVFVEIPHNIGIIDGFDTLDLSRYVYFRDYDLDGHLDILIINDDLGGGGPLKLYMSQWESGEFQGFAEEGAARGVSYEAACGGESRDFDNDGDVDIYSGNYPGPSQDAMYINDGAGNFTVVTSTHVPPDADYTIDCNAADFNGDGKLDLLVTNENDPDYLYYNDKNDEADQGIGDYRYGAGGLGGRQLLGEAAEGAMEAGDFDGDGRMDFYWTNESGNVDRIMWNLGNDADGMVIWGQRTVPTYPTLVHSRKATVADLNGDGRMDIVVGTDERPAILRNVSVDGGIDFVDWTPYPAFPSGTVHRASHADVFDTNGDGDLDIFLGGYTDDHLFEQSPTNEVAEDDIRGEMPAVYNQDPVTVTGNVSGDGPDAYTVSNVGSDGLISIVLNSVADLRIRLLRPDGSIARQSNRGGAGVEEALQFDTSVAGDYVIEVEALSCGLAADPSGDCLVGVDDLLIVLDEWGPATLQDDGDLNGDGWINADDLLMILANWGLNEVDYVLEVLARSQS